VKSDVHYFGIIKTFFFDLIDDVKICFFLGWKESDAAKKGEGSDQLFHQLLFWSES
jgi:hypothetical protein